MQYATGQGVISARQHASNKTVMQCAHEINNLELVKNPRVAQVFQMLCKTDNVQLTNVLT